jgi:hypothetical protein
MELATGANTPISTSDSPAGRRARGPSYTWLVGRMRARRPRRRGRTLRRAPAGLHGSGGARTVRWIDRIMMHECMRPQWLELYCVGLSAPLSASIGIYGHMGAAICVFIDQVTRLRNHTEFISYCNNLLYVLAKRIGRTTPREQSATSAQRGEAGKIYVEPITVFAISRKKNPS